MLAVNGNEPNIVVTGNVTAQSKASSAGVWVTTNNGKSHVTIGGSIDAKSGVRLENDGNGLVINPKGENLDLTVWKIVASDGSIVSGTATDAQKDALKNRINYIVKAWGSETQNDFESLGIRFAETTANKFGKTTGLSQVYNTTCKNNGPLQFYITAPSGKRVKTVYGYYAGETGVAQAEAAANYVTRQGDLYSLEVRDGGGIMLFVEFEDDVDDAPQATKETGENDSLGIIQAQATQDTQEDATAHNSIYEPSSPKAVAAAPSHALPATADASLIGMLPAVLAGAASLTTGIWRRRK